MLSCRLSNILHPARILFKKFICPNEIQKCEFNGTLYLLSKTPGSFLKRPKNPYLRFASSMLLELTAKYPDASYEAKRTMIKNLWNSMDVFEKKIYNDAFYEEYDKYQFAQLQYECQMQDTPKNKEESTEMTENEKRKLKKERKLSGRPRRPINSYIAFLKYKRGAFSNTQFVESIRKLSQEYRNLSPDEKKIFEDEAKKSLEVYKKKMIEWEEEMVKAGRTDLLHRLSKFEKETT